MLEANRKGEAAGQLVVITGASRGVGVEIQGAGEDAVAGAAVKVDFPWPDGRPHPLRQSGDPRVQWAARRSSPIDNVLPA